MLLSSLLDLLTAAPVDVFLKVYSTSPNIGAVDSGIACYYLSLSLEESGRVYYINGEVRSNTHRPLLQRDLSLLSFLVLLRGEVLNWPSIINLFGDLLGHR